MMSSDLANIKDGTELMRSPMPQNTSISAVAEQSKAIAEVQAQYIMAIQRPRNEDQAVVRIDKMCKRPSLAEKAEYCFPRGKKTVRGPSSDLIRQIARHWMNIDTGIRELSREHGVSEVAAFAIDLECNYKVERTFSVKHWRDTQQGGYQLTDERDINELIFNMGARRQRACLEAIIPADVIEEAVAACRRTLEKNPLSERIPKMLKTYEEIGVSPRMLEQRAEKALKDFTHSDVTEFGALFQAIKEGEMKVGTIFPGAGSGAPPSEGQSRAPGAGKAQKEAAPPPKENKKGKPETSKAQPSAGQSPKAAKPPERAPQQPASNRSAGQSAANPQEPQHDLWDEVKAMADELWRKDAPVELERLCGSMGMNYTKLSDSNISTLLDILTERLGMQQ
jgi:hypothetical protein